MSISTTQDLFFNLAAPYPGSFLIDLAGTIGTAAFPVFDQKNNFPVRIYLARQPANHQSGTPPTVDSLAAGDVLALTGRLATNLQSESLLFSIVDLAEGTDGDARKYYEGTLDLNEGDINAFFRGSPENELSYVGELKIINEAEPERRRSIGRWTSTITRTIYHGNEGVPTEGDPVYPLPGSILTKASAVELLPGVTTRVGGGATALNGQDLTAGDAGRYFDIDLAGVGMETWKFRAGDDATNEAGGIIRHADWTDTTFEFVFERRR